MADLYEQSSTLAQIDPSLIPEDVAEHLAEETLSMVHRMMAIPKYRAAVEDFTKARKAAERG